MNFLSSLMEDTLQLFYPHICKGCGNDNLSIDQQLCFHCFNSLPKTGFINHVENATEKIFNGRLDIVKAHSEFYFSKGKIIQSLLHQLKYKGNKNIGIFLGELLGRTISEHEYYFNIDFIVPMPLFKEKELKRGYNQAAVIGQGISSILKKPMLENIVVRNRTTQTQTRMHRTERWLNVNESFFVKNPSILENKKILLIDDVVTTGATMEACGREILNVKNTQLSIATIAIATK